MLAALIAGCAATPYQPADGDYGYADERVAPGRYRITASGNAWTDAQTLHDQLMLRAAEIALEQGYDYFSLTRDRKGRQIRFRPAYLSPQFGVGPGAGPIPLLRYEGLPPGAVPSPQLIASATMVLETAEGAQEAFDARAVRERLKVRFQ